MAERFGFFAVVGRPNVGKSSLVNRLIGEKVSITSRRPQTTRNRILGVRTEGTAQTGFVDTPGMQLGNRDSIIQLMKPLNQAQEVRILSA